METKGNITFFFFFFSDHPDASSGSNSLNYTLYYDSVSCQQELVLKISFCLARDTVLQCSIN